MRKIVNWKSSFHFFLWSIVMLFMLLSTQTAFADEFDNAYNWSAYSAGQGKIHMKLMYADLHAQNWYVQNSDGKCGYVTVKDNTNQKHQILSFYEDDKDNESDESAWRWCHIQSHYGTCVITNVYPSSTGDVMVSSSGRWYKLQKTAGEAGPCYIELDWYYPAELSGRTGDFYIDLNISHRSDIKEQLFASGLQFTSIDADKPTLMEPQLAPDQAHAGQIMLGYQMQKEPREINVQYYSTKYNDRLTSLTPIETTERAGFVYFDAYNGAEGRFQKVSDGRVVTIDNTITEPLANTSLRFLYVYSVNDRGEPVAYNTVISDSISIPLLHNPRKLTLRNLRNGSTLVMWDVAAPDYIDIMPDDIFEIQRATDEDFTDAQTIGTVNYVFGTRSFDYEDTKESFIQNYHEGQVYYYRVRRQAQAIWGWQGCAEASIQKNLFLLQPERATAEKTDNWEQNHEVKLTWRMEYRDQEDSEGNDTYGVYDERSQMKLSIEMLGKNGDVLYTEQSLYPHAQLDTKEMLLKLDRSCVDFRFKLEVVRGASTLPFFGEQRVVYAENKQEFRYDNFGSIKNFTATRGEHPEYVELEWEVDDGDIDYFKVQRTLHGKNDWITIKTDLQTTYYRDATALPLEDYDYQVVGITVCEDYIHESKSNVVTGNRQHTASVEGYVRYPDGMAAADVKLVLDPPVAKDYQGDLIDFSASNNPDTGNGSDNGETGNERQHYVVQSNGDFVLPKQFTLQMIFVNNNSTGTLFEKGNFKVSVREAAHGKALAIGNTNQAYINNDYNQLSISYDGETDNMYGRIAQYSYERGLVATEILNIKLGLKDKEDLPSKILLGVSNELQGETSDLFSKLSSYGGMVDEVRLYDRMLTDQEMDQSNRNFNKNNGTEEGLILYWDFENENANIRNKAEGGSRDLDATTYLLKSYDDNLYCIDSTDTEDGKVKTTASIVRPNSHYTLKRTGNAEVVTDENGHYVISGIPYTEESTFTVAPVNNGDGNKFEPESQSVTFTLQKNVYKNVDFTLTSTYKMTATVLYEGSSIPVQNAQVKLNGKILHNAVGEPVVTNNHGEVSFRMPKGKNTIQVVKDGHVFLDEGYYMEHDSRDIEVLKDISEVYFWDKTKVKVIGRICGGSDQGNLPMGQDLSRNNLGDSLLMVMALEGDNTSWIVRDQFDSSVKEYRETINHHDGKHQTDYYANRHRIEIRPDKNSGEFVAYLYPVKYKITEISAKGYPTLFQDGKVGEVIDLTDSVMSHNEDGVDYNAIFRHVYHSPIQLSYEQFVPGRIPFLGEKQYRATNSYGEEVMVPIVEFVTDPITNITRPHYVFGHPVFDQNRTYMMNVSAHEDYYYNNVRDSVPDKVMMHGGKLKVYNGLVSGTEQMEDDLDENGECQILIKASDVSYTAAGENALKTLSMSVEIDSTFVEAETIRAYVMGSRPKEQGRELVTDGNTYLFDILRDPPGSSSSAYIEEGTTMSYSYKRDFTLKGGFGFTVSKGSGKNGLIGTIQGPVVQADIFSASTDFSVSTDIVTTYHFDKVYKYSFTANKRISTSSGAGYVGTPGDVFIGVTEAMIIKDAVAVRCVDDRMFQQVQANLPTGALKEIASGVASDGNKYHIIRDEVLSLGSQIKSSFAYTQKYIEKTLIPNLQKLRNSQLFTGTIEEALAKANHTRRPVYWTKRSPEADDFGVDNVENGKHVEYNTSREDLSYMIVLPEGVSMVEADTIYALNSKISMWVGFLGQNEREKIEAYDKVGTYSVSGGTSFTYSDTYTGSLDQSRYIKWPFANGAALNFSEIAANLKNTVNLNVVKLDNNNLSGYKLEFGGFKIDLKFKPIFDISDNYNNGKSESSKKTIGCTVTPDVKGDLTFEILRTNTIKYDSLKAWVEKGKADIVLSDINEYYNKTHDKGLMDYISDEQKEITKYGSLVYRTLAGSTKCPYEDERKTKYYSPGVVYDVKTKKIENPRITIDNHEVSNVPADQPAKFVLTMFNDSETPQAGPFTFDLIQMDGTNAKGAQLFIDGVPVSDGRTFVFASDEILNKVLEVYCGEGYDFEDLGLKLGSQCDVGVFSVVNFSAHFIPSAGNIHVSAPTDKWVMNTESAYDNGYYLPVKIDGYNVNHRGFDHIELQYKLSTQSDRDWVNICSYYNDEKLMAKASGTCSLIGNNGYIEGRLYGEKDPVEQYYDLRAVVYCRNGNDFVTSSSPVLSGIKDTRRPTVFGNPQPADGVLNIDDDIMVKFSENIAGNYLSKVNNFEVTGVTNSTEITQNTSLEFSGNGYLMTDAKRNLATKDITVEMLLKPNFNGKDMPVFSHGSDDTKLEFWVKADGKLMASINGMEYISAKSVDFSGFRQVAMTLNQDTQVLKFYAGGTVIGEFDGVPEYEGSTVLVFGKDHENKHFYSGNMLEVRLWYRELNGQELSRYGFKRLTGYETGLVDYYMLNEGDGLYVQDKAQGATAKLYNLGWTLPKGMSLHIDFEDNGVKLNDRLFQRTADQDYTLMFWFKTDQEGRGALLSNGEGKLTDADYKNKFFIGFEGRDLIYRSGGMEIKVPGTYDDNVWHQYAMTVNRPRNIGHIYLDHVLRATFGLDSLGGISGDRLYLGSKHYVLKDQQNTEYQMNNLRGDIDELAMFEQVMPENVIKNYYNISPSGREMGLMVHAPFSKYEKQLNNTIQAVPSVLSTRVYRDAEGNILENRADTVLADVTDPVSGEILEKADFVYARHVNEESFAPVRDRGEMENLNYSFTAKDNELIINLNELDWKIEKTNVYVTIREVPDLNGNYMASPTTFSFFVDRNQLRWKDKYVARTVKYGEGDSFDVLIENKGGSLRNYQIEGMPDWMDVSPYMGSVNALDQENIHINVSRDLNVGSYDVVLFLRNDNDVCERLSMVINVEGERPSWTVTSKRTYTMNILARVMINDAIDTDTADVVGAFDKSGNCMGLAHVNLDTRTGETFVYLTVYDDNTDSKQLYFKLWDASTGVTYVTTPNFLETPTKVATIKFEPNAIVGSISNPLILNAGTTFVQKLSLKEGWNWVSFNVYNTAFRDITNVLYGFDWKVGDQLKDPMTGAILGFTEKGWVRNDKTERLELKNDRMYAVKVDKSVEVEISGGLLTSRPQRTINLVELWNYIGYTPNVNLPITTALSEYFDYANDGDMVKSQHEFAVFHKNGKNDGEWKGNLKYMKTGEGYMLFRNSKSGAEFTYPFVKPGTSFFDGSITKAQAPAHYNSYGSSMALVALPTGIEIEPGDRLIAYGDAEIRGVAEADEDGNFYISIGGDKQVPLAFGIEREGMLVALTQEVMSYQANTISGNPDNPTRIDFVKTDFADGYWYTLQGVRLNHKPAQSGVYIFNGKKVVVK